MKILYKFPSRNRPSKFFKAVDNIASLSTWSNYEILATFDLNDPTMTTPGVKEMLKMYPEVRSMYGTSNGKIHSCNRDMEFSGDWQIVILMSDDQEFLVKGFDSMIVNEMKETFPDLDGTLHYPDSHGRWMLSVLSIMGRKYFDRFGYFYHPEYDSLWADNEYTDVATILNKRKFVPKKIYEHMHHIWQLSEADALNVRNDSTDLWVKDNATYQRRKAIDFGLNIFQ